jgi:1-acyl-sn-glycerol-3-phosphate acyltransferase
MSKIRGIIALSFGFLVFAITMPPYCFAMLFLIPWRSTRIRMGNRYSQIIGPLLISFTGTKLRITGAEHLDPSRPAIYLNNHSSNLDPLIAMSICPVGGCGISKKQLALIPFFGQIYWLSGHLLIDRSNRKRAIASIREMTSIVEKNDLSLWIWPEGTRSRTGRLTPFKKGFVHLALDTKLPIVPIISHNAHLRWPARTVRMFPGTMHIEVLPPMDTTGWTHEQLDLHLTELQELYNNKLDVQQRLQGPSQSQA